MSAFATKGFPRHPPNAHACSHSASAWPRCNASADEARQHAQAEWNRIQRGAATLSLTLALGRSDLYPEQRLRVSGYKPEIDGNDWLIAKTTHNVTGSGGYTTSVELEHEAH